MFQTPGDLECDIKKHMDNAKLRKESVQPYILVQGTQEKPKLTFVFSINVGEGMLNGTEHKIEHVFKEGVSIVSHTSRTEF